MNDSTLKITRREFLLAGAAGSAVVGVEAKAAGAADLAYRGSPDALVSTAQVTLNVNGESHALELDTRTTLLDALREHVHLTGSKKGLRSRPVRRLYRADRWSAHQFLSDTCSHAWWRQDHHH